METLNQIIEEQKKNPEAQLYAVLNNIALEMSSKLDAARQWKMENYDHSEWNWASEIHHPCLRHLVYCRLNWKDKQFIDIDGIYRVEEGIDQERKIIMMLSEIGIEVNQTQRSFRDYETRISGKIDGTISLKSLNNLLPIPDEFKGYHDFPMEAKTVNPTYWNSTRTIEDLKRHPKFWINKIPSQLNLYCYMMGRPGGFIVLKTFGKKPRILPMILDYELAEYDLNRAKEVNRYVEAKEYPPPIPYDETICGLCGFNHICMPLKATDYVEVPDISEFELEEYLFLKEQKKKFEELHSRLIGSKKKPGLLFGKDVVIGDIEIRTKKYKRKVYSIPKEVREQYVTGVEEIISTSIERLGQ